MNIQVQRRIGAVSQSTAKKANVTKQARHRQGVKTDLAEIKATLTELREHVHQALADRNHRAEQQGQPK